MAGNDVYKLKYLHANAVYMAKLYWRVKIDGKWTWRPAICTFCKLHDEKFVCDDCCYINKPEDFE